jgi:H+-transporting ATPase
MPIMIWLTMVILLVKSLCCKPAWPDFVMCSVLQCVNGNVKFYITQNAKNALDALKSKMAPEAIARRNAQWKTVPASALVPGDVIQIKIGDIVPADCRVGPADNIQADQAALTGESLPKSVAVGDKLYASSVIKRGEGEAVVVATGAYTEMGKAAKMVSSVKKRSRYDKVLFFVALYLLCMAMCCMTIQFIYMVAQDGDVLGALSVVVAILIGALPVAMHVVCMVIMATGAFRLSVKGAVVSELTATEELSGMSVLCSDKTGTLTLNKLSIIADQTIPFDCTYEDLLWYAGLSAKRVTEGQDAIDFCITKTVAKEFPETWAKMEGYITQDFLPFDPEIKRTEATIRAPDGTTFKCAKGSPQIMVQMVENRSQIEERANKAIDDLASRGFRTLGVAKGTPSGGWVLVGLLAIADPPRHDTKEVVKKAQALGIKVIMITGDHTSIAREVGRQIGIGENILPASVLSDFDNGKLSGPVHERFVEVILRCDGFAEVLPEHKFRVVELLQQAGHIVGMTGDGVNDAPALKKANVGIAVSGASEAARAASSMFLQEEGLSVIVDAICRSKKVFERVKNYIVYRSATSLRLMGFFFCCTMFIDPASWLKVGDSTATEYGYREYCSEIEDRAVMEDDGRFLVASNPYSRCIRAPVDMIRRLDEGLSHFSNTDGWYASVDGSAYLRSNCTAFEDDMWTGFGTLAWERTCVTDTTAGSGYKRSAWAQWQSMCERAASSQSDWDAEEERHCVRRLAASDMHVSSYFQTPTIVVIVLTVLNDFTVITIAFDHVSISSTPDTWWLWRNILVGTVIGGNTLFWSIVLFTQMLAAMDPNGWQCQDWGVCLEYPEVLVGAFLQLSLCARFALTNARTNKWFWMIGLHRSTVVTMSGSLIAAILLGFFWPFCPSEDACAPRMVPLNPRMAAIIVAYQVPVHFIRDACKLLTYRIFRGIDEQKAAPSLERKAAMDRDVYRIMRDTFGMAAKPPEKVQMAVHDEIALGLRSSVDQGPCLPLLPACTGPAFFKLQGCGRGCGFNAFLVISSFTTLGVVGIILSS